MARTRQTLPEEIKGFRLLGIRPLTDCDLKLSKLLHRGRVYQFYNDIKILPEIIQNNEENINCQDSSKNPDLFSIITDQGKFVKVNISALVGKNGSGKSTLLELLYASVFFMADRKGLFQQDGLEYYINELAKSEIEKIEYDNKSSEIYDLNSLIDNPNIKIEEFNKIIKSYSEIIEGLKLDLYIEVSSNIFQVRFNENVTIKQLRGEKDHNINLENLFYNIAINYSIHSLNSRVIGKWIDPLFHKNDGYLTPLVINPMREDGNIKVNNEATLAKYRLASNLISNSKQESFQLTENQYAKYFLYEIDISKIDTLKGNKLNITLEVLKRFEVTEEMRSKPLFSVEVLSYIYQKIEKILWQYPIYRKKYTTQIESSRYDFSETILWNEKNKLADEIYEDGSHITFKLRQAIYYLKYNLFSNLDGHISTVMINKQVYNVGKWSELNEKKYLLLEVDKVSDYVLNNLKAENVQIKKMKRTGDFTNKNFELSALPFLPPPIFSIEIILSNKDNTLSLFSELSSGEQQMIHTLHSVYYHLYNLQSVFTIPIRQKGERKTYRNINILFDEIELYFHPEYQREFISRFRKGLKHLNIGGDKGIDSINVLFATHSPFILSDIPANNILRLENGAPSNETFQKTFGANIYDLLKNDFFLNKGFIGEFAIEKIKEVIDYTESKVYDPILHKKFEKIVDTIGDEIIQIKLKQLLLDVYNTANDNSEIETLIKQRDLLNDQIEKLKNDNNTI